MKKKTEKAKHVTSSPPVLQEIFVRNSRIGGRGLWGEGQGGLLANITLHSLPEYKVDKRQLQENTKSGDFLTAVVSGVIFQVIGVSSWAEVKHIRISSSRIFCSKFFLRTARKQFLMQTRKKFYIESLSPEEKLSNEQFSLKFTIFSNKTYLIISLSKYTASQERIRLQNQGKVFINNNGEFEKISNRLWSFLYHFVSTVFSQTKYIQKPPQHQNIRND